MQHPGDRPDRPPVWVRGGPPYYYTPQNPHAPALTEEMRRASAASASSGSSGSSAAEAPQTPTASPNGSSAFPSMPAAPAAEAAWREEHGHSRGIGSPSQFPIGQSQSQGLTGSPFGLSRSGLEPFAGGGIGQFPRRSSSNYRNLTMQKRESSDESMKQRRQSWKEMLVGSDPDKQRFYRKWWDGFTKGAQTKGNE